MPKFLVKFNDPSNSVTAMTIVEASSLVILNNYLDNKYPGIQRTITKSVDYGNALFANEKTKNILFSDVFSKVPSIKITLDDQSFSIPYKTNTSVRGFTIKFQVNYNGLLSWEAVEQ